MKFIPDAAKRALSSKALLARKNGPHILFVAGVAGVIGGTILACRATLKLEDKLDEFKADIDAHKADHSGRAPGYQRGLAYIYTDHTFELVKLYALPVGIMTVSIGALTGSHVTLSKRNSALMSAYAVVSSAYENYRERVRAEVGEAKELDIYRGVTRETVTTPDGKKAEHVSVDPNGLSTYSRVFDECSRHWQKDPEMNRTFLACQQEFCNQKLRVKGYLFLNEVYEMLGFEPSHAGQVVGWILGPDSDNYVDFGMFEAHNSRFVNGLERSVWLDFNVDGVILDKVKF